ncbi:MAG: SBBP repeat-containing protein [Candidatus Thorarchaeota archaeon]
MLSWKNQHWKKVKSLNVLIVLLLSLWLINPLGVKPTVSIMEEIDGLSATERELLDLEKEGPPISDEVRSKVAETLKGFAGGFLRNLGEKVEDIYFYTQSADMAAGFSASEVRFRIANPAPQPSKAEEPELIEEYINPLPSTTLVLDFPGSKAVIPVAEEPTGATNNYYRGTNPATWSNSNPYYQKLVYHDIYEKIDLVYEVRNNQLKYEFVVYPGGKIDNIKMHWSGPVSLELVPDEGFRVQASLKNGGSASTLLVDSLPTAYQMSSRETPLAASFNVLEASTYGFSVPTYDPTKRLIIDPVISPMGRPSYSTYVAGSRSEYVRGIAVDYAGNAYVTGETFSTDFPAVNAYNATGDGSTSWLDVFVFKLAADGNALLYSTYIAGSRDDNGRGIAVDAAGHAYVTGFTYSTDFPAVNAYNATGDGSTSYTDAFVFKLAVDGSALLYSTYVAGSSSDAGRAIAVDNAGNAYVAGDTYSTDFPAVNAYNATGDGSWLDVFVFKLAADGGSLLYSTYVSGSAEEWGRGITVDTVGNAYVTGDTRSTDFPVVNAYNATGDGSTTYRDVFVFKLASNGSALLYSTYVAGSNDEWGRAIAVDYAGNAYVTGETISTDFPVANAYDPTGDGSTTYQDAFVFKLTADGSDLLYSTYVAGSLRDYGTGIAVDTEGHAYVMGYTVSTDFPVVNAYNATGDGSTTYADVFVIKFATDGSDLLYSTYISGSHDDIGRGIAVDTAGNVYVAGETQSTDFPAVNAYNSTGDGSTTFSDVFVFKLSTHGGYLDYATYISGSLNDQGFGIAVDSAGNIYVTGYTASADFPTTPNAYNTTADPTFKDVFVLKLAADVSTLVYSTYVGGSHNDEGFEIDLDSSGNVYVMGYSTSANFPTTPNAYNETGDGDLVRRDVIVFKLASDGGTLLYSTYVGGSLNDYGTGLAVDEVGNAYVSGHTSSTDFPTTPNAYNTTGDGAPGFTNAFVFKLAANGSKLLYSTYVWGTGQDSTGGIAIDSSGNAYVVGHTTSDDFPMVNAYNGTKGGEALGSDVFVFKLAADGRSLRYSTYVGGNESDYGEGIAVDNTGVAYVIAGTLSPNFPTLNAYQPTKTSDPGIKDMALFKLAQNGSSLLYSTYIGGSSHDSGIAIAVDNMGDVFVTGYTLSPDFPTLNAYDANGDGNPTYPDVILFKLAADGSRFLYSTYVAGSLEDYGIGMAVTSADTVYITGYTKSPDFPAVNAYNATGDGNANYDGFVLKMTHYFPPTPPTQLMASLTASHQVLLTWSSPLDEGNSPIIGYRIYRGTSSGFYDSFLAETTSEDFVDTTVVDGVTYYYIVTAVNALGESLFSNEVSTTPTAIPTVPQNFSATSGDNFIELSWIPPIDDGGSVITSYRIYRGTTSGIYALIGIVTTGMSFNDTTARAGTTYYYIVSAVNGVGESLFSDEISATPTGTPPITITAPDAPQSLSATVGGNFVNLSWAVPSSDGGFPITGYRVYRGTTSGIYALAGVVSTTSFNDTPLAGGMTYYYVVTAINAAGESDFSEEVSATPTGIPASTLTAPGIPQSVSATAGENSILLSWTAPTDDGGVTITSYRVYRGTSSGVYALIGVLTTGTSYEDTTAAKGTTYYYVVTAVNGIGESSFSIEVSATITMTSATSELPKTSESEDGAAPGFLVILLCLGVLVVLGRKRKAA